MTPPAPPSVTLLPCPFCGADAEMRPWHGGGPDKQIVWCSDHSTDCPAGPMVTGETPAEAITAWNTRTTAEAASAAERRNLVSHATGGQHTGEGMSLNDICVAISAFRNTIYAAGIERGETASAARVGELVRALRACEELLSDQGFYGGRTQRLAAEVLAKHQQGEVA